MAPSHGFFFSSASLHLLLSTSTFHVAPPPLQAKIAWYVLVLLLQSKECFVILTFGLQHIPSFKVFGTPSWIFE